MDLTLKDVLYILKLKGNIFSLTTTLEPKGVQFSSKEELISVKIGSHQIFFDKHFKHCSGHEVGIDIYPTPSTYLLLHKLWTSILSISCLDVQVFVLLLQPPLSLVFLPRILCILYQLFNFQI
jgi:hypothetical protein